MCAKNTTATYHDNENINTGLLYFPPFHNVTDSDAYFFSIVILVPPLTCTLFPLPPLIHSVTNFIILKYVTFKSGLRKELVITILEPRLWKNSSV